jgi:hypothetical protein
LSSMEFSVMVMKVLKMMNHSLMYLAVWNLQTFKTLHIHASYAINHMFTQVI